MVNNKDLIIPLLTFPKPGDSFFFTQIISRKKDNPQLGNNSRVIKTYFIKSIEHLNFHWEEMCKLAELFNARVSINLNPRSFEKAGFQVISKIANQMENKDYTHIYRAYESICGNYHSEMDKRWLIDLDKDQVELKDKIIQYVQLAYLTSKSNGNILAEIPSKSGIHLIVNPFNRQQFSITYPNIEIHGNNPTLLYYKEKEI